MSARNSKPPSFLKVVPDFDPFLRGARAVLKAPFQDFVVGAAFEDAGLEGAVGDAEERDSTLVEALAEIRVEVRVEFAGGHEPDFVEHTADVNDAAEGFLG